MSDKRRDNKGRILQNGERQRNDGSYEYRYTTSDGKKHSVYSWRLVTTDKTPIGKRVSESLREMEKRIAKELERNPRFCEASKIRLNDAYEKYFNSRTDLKPASRRLYDALYRVHVRDTIGMRTLTDIRHSDIISFYTILATERSLEASTVRVINAVISQIFKNALRDELITSDPTNGAVGVVLKRTKKTPNKRHALTVPQQRTLLDCVRSSGVFSFYYPLIIFLLGTGCRIGEAGALRWSDCDFDDNIIHIRHTLFTKNADKSDPEPKVEYILSDPKTQSSVRDIPMIREVKSALTTIRDATNSNADEFVFHMRTGGMIRCSSISRMLKSICSEHNRKESARADREERKPVLLPEITAHILRHTFCVRACENGLNPKVVQELMGHQSINVTMDVYNEATLDSKVGGMNVLEGRIYLGSDQL